MSVWLTGAPVTGVGAQWAPALPAIGMLVLLFSSPEPALHVVGLLFGVVGLLLWRLGNRLAAPLAGLVAGGPLLLRPERHERGDQQQHGGGDVGEELGCPSHDAVLRLCSWLSHARRSGVAGRARRRRRTRVGRAPVSTMGGPVDPCAAHWVFLIGPALLHSR